MQYLHLCCCRKENRVIYLKWAYKLSEKLDRWNGKNKLWNIQIEKFESEKTNKFSNDTSTKVMSTIQSKLIYIIYVNNISPNILAFVQSLSMLW